MKKDISSTFTLFFMIMALVLYGCSGINNLINDNDANPTFTGTVKRYDYSSTVQTQGLVKAMTSGGGINEVQNVPLEGATVTIIESNQSTSTDTNGNFGFEEIPTGTFTLEIKKDQYIPLRVTADETTSINVITSEDFFHILDGGSWLFKNTIDNTIATVNVTRDTKYLKWVMELSENLVIGIWLEYDYFNRTVYCRYDIPTTSTENVKLDNPNIRNFNNLPFVKYPLKVNEEIVEILNGGDTMTYKVEEKLDTLEVQGNSYEDVFKVKLIQRQGTTIVSTIIYYLDSTKGMIKLSIVNSSNTKSLELLSN